MGKLIIGVGGTGTKIVRAMQMRWSSLGGRPTDVALAVIDARERTPEGGEIPGVKFQANAPLNFEDDYRQFQQHVESWWPTAVVPTSAVNFGAGCGAIRAYGRYFAFRYAPKIIRTIEDATAELVMKRRDTVGDRRLAFSVIVVGSLGNGTGGGTLFDVATIARHHLSYASDEVRCMGVFIPGAVTRKGNAGVLDRRVAASGFASLLELQYEFNRADKSSSLRPKDPYSFLAWNGITFSEFRAGRSEQVSPFESVLLLNETDRNGLTLGYESLINVAAEGISMLVEGGDQDFRLVDSMTMISNSGAKRFGSFGAARLTVPGDKMLSWAIGSHAISAVHAASGADVDKWRDLLADETPGDAEKKYLRRENATLDASVDFFIEHILKVKETTKNNVKEGAAFNQLVDRFQLDDNRTLKEFDDIISDLDRLTDPKALVNRAIQIGNFVDERTEHLKARRTAALFGDEDSLWRRPSDPADPASAGIKLLINERVMEFVRAGAFGLLAAWLEEFKNQIAVNSESISVYEKKQWLKDKRHKSIDLTKSLGELAREADGFFRMFRRNALLEGVGLVRQEARNKFEYLLWETKTEAVEAFYAEVDGHVEKLRAAAEAVARRLTGIEYTQHFANKRDRAAAALDEQHEATPSAGLKAEIFLGGDEEMRAELLELVRSGTSTTEREILQRLPAHGMLFGDRIRSDAKSLGLVDVAQNLPDDAEVIARDFIVQLEARVNERIETIVTTHCSIDAVLESRAEHLLDLYRHARHEAGAKMRSRNFATVKSQIEKAAGRNTLELLEQLPWDHPEEDVRERGITLLIAGELNRLIAFATPQWSLTSEVLRTVHVTGHQFLTYPAAARWLPRAIKLMEQWRGHDVLLKAQESKFGDPMRIDTVFVEVGADVDVLRNESEVEAYRWAMYEERAFSPHLTRDYHEMGTRYLERSGQRAKQSDVILALAEEYGLVSADKIGHYKLKIEIKQKTDRKTVVYPNYAAGFSVGPRGLENVVATLDEREGEGRRLLTALKDLVYEAMKTEAFGTEDGRGIGWSGVANRVGSRAGKLRARIEKENNPAVAEIVRRQAEGLDLLAAEIQDSQGRTVPKLFT